MPSRLSSSLLHHNHLLLVRSSCRSPRSCPPSPTPLRNALPQRRTMIAAPRPGSGPLTSRRPDRALPEIPRPWRIWLRTLPIFFAIMTVSALGLFNYQKQSSSVVASTMYALRMSPRGREVLGDEIYYRDQFPWIWGQLNQLHGRIDIQFGVKGTRSSAMMRFKSERRERMGFFETKEWSLTTPDGAVIQLLNEGNSGSISSSSSNKTEDDPFKGSILQTAESATAASQA